MNTLCPQFLVFNHTNGLGLVGGEPLCGEKEFQNSLARVAQLFLHSGYSFFVEKGVSGKTYQPQFNETICEVAGTTSTFPLAVFSNSTQVLNETATWLASFSKKGLLCVEQEVDPNFVGTAWLRYLGIALAVSLFSLGVMACVVFTKRWNRPARELTA